jgi:DNA repair exonuclease SbcCD ATPase subunit
MTDNQAPDWRGANFNEATEAKRRAELEAALAKPLVVEAPAAPEVVLIDRLFKPPAAGVEAIRERYRHEAGTMCIPGWESTPRIHTLLVALDSALAERDEALKANTEVGTLNIEYQLQRDEARAEAKMRAEANGDIFKRLMKRVQEAESALAESQRRVAELEREVEEVKARDDMNPIPRHVPGVD